MSARPIGSRSGACNLAALAILLCGSLARAWADDWPGWRGPTGQGHSEERDLPLTWDGKSGENIRWKAALGDRPCYSSPIVHSGRVFVAYGTGSKAPPTVEIHDGKEVKRDQPDDQWLACFDAETGQEKWRVAIKPGPHVGSASGYAAPTPVADDQRVYVWYGTGVLVAIDFDGKEAWRLEFEGPLKLNPGICSSPVLYRETVFVLCDQGDGKSFLAAVDKQTGELSWKKNRPEVSHTNTTPLVVNVEGETRLIVAASNRLQALDPMSGEPVWWCSAESFYPSPVYANGLVVGDGNLFQAVGVDGEGETTDNVRWKTPRGGEVIGSPIVVDEHVYRIQKPGILTCWNLATGKRSYSERLEGADWWASPVATADGRIYFASAGTTYVVQSGAEFKLLAKNVIEGGEKGSSAAIADGKIFLCGSHQLYCIGQE